MTFKKLVIATPSEAYRLIERSPGFAAQFLRKLGYNVFSSDLSEEFLREICERKRPALLMDDFLLHVQPFGVNAYRTGYCTRQGMFGNVVSQENPYEAKMELNDAVITYLSDMSRKPEFPLWAITTGIQMPAVIDLFRRQGIRDIEIALPCG